MNLRLPKLLKLAKEAPICMCCQSANDGTVVGAHPNGHEFGKGVGLKAHDLVAYMCMDCHDWYDGRRPGWNAIQKRQAWHMAFYRTMLWLFQDSGHITVK